MSDNMEIDKSRLEKMIINATASLATQFPSGNKIKLSKDAQYVQNLFDRGLIDTSDITAEVMSRLCGVRVERKSATEVRIPVLACWVPKTSSNHNYLIDKPHVCLYYEAYSFRYEDQTLGNRPVCDVRYMRPASSEEIGQFLSQVSWPLFRNALEKAGLLPILTKDENPVYASVEA